jgi:hypothetical protein
MPLDRTLIWPLYIATIPAGALATVPWLFPDGARRDPAAALFNRGAPVYLAALAVIVIVTSLAQWQRVGPRPTAEQPPSSRQGVGASLIVLTVLTLAAITVVPEFLTTQLGQPMLIDGRLMTAIVAVALAM